MSKKIFRLTLLIMLSHLLGLAAISQTNENINGYLKELLLKSQKDHHAILSNYSYKFLREYHSNDGKKQSELTESYFPDRYGKKEVKSVTIVIAKNGVPLSEKEIEKNRKKALEELEDYSKNAKYGSLAEDKGKGVALEWRSWGLSAGLKSFIENCKFEYGEKMMLNGRETQILKFGQCSSAGLSESFMYIKELSGELWADVATRSIAKLAAWSNADTAKKPLLIIQQQFVNNKFWYPNLIQINTLDDRRVFRKYKYAWKIEFRDFVEDKVEVRAQEVKQ